MLRLDKGEYRCTFGFSYGGFLLCAFVYSAQYKYRFGVLHKLGVEQQEKERLALKQLAVWFGLPISVAVLMSVLIIACFFQTIAVQITAYVGWNVLLRQVAVMVVILGALLLCYFIITYVLFKPAIQS